MSKEDLIIYSDQFFEKERNNKSPLSGQTDPKPATSQAETTGSGTQPKRILADIDALTRRLTAGDRTERAEIREAATTLLTPKTTQFGARPEYTGDELIEYGILKQSDIWTNRLGNSRVTPRAIDKLYRLLDALYNAQLAIRAVDEAGGLTAPHVLQYRYQGALPYKVALYLEPELRYHPNPLVALLPEVELRVAQDTFGSDPKDFVPFPTNSHEASKAKSMAERAAQQVEAVSVRETSLYEKLSSPDATGPSVFTMSKRLLPSNILDRLIKPSYYTYDHVQ